MHVLPLGRNDITIINVDATVEKGSAVEDVLLVQFLLWLCGKHAPPTVPQAVKEKLLNVPRSGRADDATVEGIKALQTRMRVTHPETVVDGRVSPARAGGNYAGRVEWSIVTLNAFVRNHFLGKWPRLQDIPGCPEVVRARLRVIV
jgi:hypothetical protein